MTLNEQTLDEYQSQVRQMVGRLRQLHQENAQLRNSLAKADEECKALRKSLDQANDEYQALKTARMLAVADGDIEAAKQRMAAMIRDVDRCMAILAEQQ